MDDLLLIEEKIDLEVRSLETCMFDHKTFTDILNRIQKAVDDLNLYSYSNLPIWVNKLDIEVGTSTNTDLKKKMMRMTVLIKFRISHVAGPLQKMINFSLHLLRLNASSACGCRLV